MKLLFVDPNKTFQQIVTTLFADADIEIGFAASRAEAMAMAETDWQFVCMARHLFDGDGLALCMELRARPAYRYIPLVLFTTDADESLQREAAQAGATEVFLKTNVADLINFVSRYSVRIKKIRGRILYVEDSAAQALAIQQLLASIGLTVEWSGSAEEAWEVFQKRTYDLVLTDIVLSGTMTGAALISRIRRLPDESGDTPIIAVTAFDQLARRIGLFHLGVNDYVAKPIVEEELISRIRNLVERRNAERLVILERKRRFDETLLQLSGRLNAASADLTGTLAELCRASAEALGVARASVWQLTADHSEIHCLTLQVDGRDSQQVPEPLRRTAAPASFDALTERTIVAGEAWTHPATSDLRDSYLIPLGIGAVIYIPLGPTANRSGALCYEHVGPTRKWSGEEEGFAAAVGDLVTLAFETHERWRADQQVRLAGLVFEAASEAILICDRDNRILTANEAFTKMSGYMLDEIVGKTPSMFKSGRQSVEFYAEMWRGITEQGNPNPAIEIRTA